MDVNVGDQYIVFLRPNGVRFGESVLAVDRVRCCLDFGVVIEFILITINKLFPF
jgi:hypothetical protein